MPLLFNMNLSLHKIVYSVMVLGLPYGLFGLTMSNGMPNEPLSISEQIGELTNRLQRNPQNIADWKQRGKIYLKHQCSFQALSDFEKALLLLIEFKDPKKAAESIPQELEFQLLACQAAHACTMPRAIIHHATTALAMAPLFCGPIPKVLSDINKLIYFDHETGSYAQPREDIERYKEIAKLDVKLPENKVYSGFVAYYKHAAQMYVHFDKKRQERIANLAIESRDYSDYRGKQVKGWLASDAFTNNPIDVLVPNYYRAGPKGDRSAEVVLDATRRHMKHSVPTGNRWIDMLKNHAVVTDHLPFLKGDCIEIVADEKKGGFGMIATRDIKKDDIFYCEEPIVSFCEDMFQGVKRCECCLLPSEGPVKCPNCDTAYCSEECRDKDFKKIHRALCGSKFHEVLEVCCENKERFGEEAILYAMVLKMLAISATHKEKRAELGYGEPYENPMDMFPVKHLLRATDSHKPLEKDKGHFTPSYCFGTRIWDLLYRHIYDQMEDLAKKHPNCTLSDIFTIFNSLLKMNVMNLDGFFALCFIASYVNHSCVPNALYIADVNAAGDLVLFSAARDIAKGEEITFAYVTPERDLEDRQIKCESMYGFTCTCPLCIQQQAEKDRKAAAGKDKQK